MPASTARLALPYPIPDDTVDVPRDMQALATKLDGYTSIAPPPFVTVLPVSPVDRDEVHFAVNYAQGIIWHLRYRALNADGTTANTNTFKWEYVGGPPHMTEYAAREVIPSLIAGYQNLASGANPLVTAPLAGIYDIAFEARMEVGAGADKQGMAAPQIGATTASDAESIMLGNVTTGGTMNGSVHRTIRRQIAGPAAVTLLYRATISTFFSQRRISILPVMVG